MSNRRIVKALLATALLAWASAIGQLIKVLETSRSSFSGSMLAIPLSHDLRLPSNSSVLKQGTGFVAMALPTSRFEANDELGNQKEVEADPPATPTRSSNSHNTDPNRRPE